MWSDFFRRTMYSFRRINMTGIMTVVALTICYLMKFLQVDCHVLGGTQTINITSFFILVFSEQHFLSFMIPLSVILGINSFAKARLAETLQYNNRDEWIRNIIGMGTVYVIVCFSIMIMLTLITGWLCGISFKEVQGTCDAMEYVIPGVLLRGTHVDMVKLCIVNMANVLFYSFTIMMIYVFCLSITRNRHITVFCVICVAIIMLVAIKTYAKDIYIWLPVANVVVDLSYNKNNEEINWLYWSILNLVLFGLTIIINRRRNFYYDE